MEFIDVITPLRERQRPEEFLQFVRQHPGRWVVYATRADDKRGYGMLKNTQIVRTRKSTGIEWAISRERVGALGTELKLCARTK